MPPNNRRRHRARSRRAAAHRRRQRAAVDRVLSTDGTGSTVEEIHLPPDAFSAAKPYHAPQVEAQPRSNRIDAALRDRAAKRLPAEEVEVLITFEDDAIVLPAMPKSFADEPEDSALNRKHRRRREELVESVEMQRRAVKSADLPVVRTADFKTSTISLLNVPLGTERRATLRVYDPEDRGDSRGVIVRIYAFSGDLLREDAYRFSPSGYASHDGYPFAPSFIQIALPDSVGAERVRVDVVPHGEGLRFWAFISLTDNRTEHVTIIAPDP
ncbi:MAG TPA: hypothetical protein VE974_00445 [Thermoanaerobaculia bacterium]|nr:hypothetical protein [Thermoanaerobaculia bacterium]